MFHLADAKLDIAPAGGSGALGCGDGGGIVGGYPCGGPAEPCVGPTNRPYFRPNNPVTRGQMSKIAAQTFFPNCPPPGQP